MVSSKGPLVHFPAVTLNQASPSEAQLEMNLPVCNPKAFAPGNHGQVSGVNSDSWLEKEKDPHCVQNV